MQELFLKQIFSLREMGSCSNFAGNSRSCRRIIVNFSEGWDVLRNKSFDFGADQDLDQGIFNGIFLPLRDRSSCKNSASNSINNDYSALGDELPRRRFAF